MTTRLGPRVARVLLRVAEDLVKNSVSRAKPTQRAGGTTAALAANHLAGRAGSLLAGRRVGAVLARHRVGTATAAAILTALATGPSRLPTVRLPGEAERLDVAVDGWFDAHLRGRAVPDYVFYAASALGDHGIIWLALAGLQSVRRRRQEWRRPLIRAAAGLGVESALVNGPIKWLFRRSRPSYASPRPHHLRQPLTSSFPSGHATAAFFGAALLRDGDPWWPGYYIVAALVAASRVHVGIHHASDVLAGAALGVILGELARHLVPVSGLETGAASEGTSSPAAPSADERDAGSAGTARAF